MLKFSIAGYTFHALVGSGRANIFGLLESVKYRYNLGAFDLWNGLLGNDPEVYLQADFIKKLREEADRRGIVFCNYHADGCHIWEDDAGARQKNEALADRHIQAGEKLGAKTIRIDAGGRERHWTAEQFDFIAKRYRQWAKRAAQQGYKIGPQIHWGAETFLDNMEKLIAAVDSPAFGIVLSVGGVQGTTPDEGDRKLAAYTMHTHVEPKTLDTRIEDAINILIDGGYDGYLSVEDVKDGNEYERAAKLLAQGRWALEKVMAARAAKAK